MSGDQLAAAGSSEMSGLQSTTPGYVADSNFGFIQPYIRGIGNAIFLGADPSVATFVDDVPQIYGAMIDSLSDVERIEVLKRSEEHTSELQSLMRISYAVFCLTKKKTT